MSYKLRKFNTSHPIESLFAPAPSTQRGQSTRLSVLNNDTLVYTNGKGVYLRNLKNPAICQEYTGHTCQATVAVPSPSGFYVASGGTRARLIKT